MHIIAHIQANHRNKLIKWNFMGYTDIPSGNDCYIATEHGHS